MDFLETTRLLMELRERYPNLNYYLDEYEGTVVMSLRVNDDVPAMFEKAYQMFEEVN